jgi:hypothetical protein
MTWFEHFSQAHFTSTAQNMTNNTFNRMVVARYPSATALTTLSALSPAIHRVHLRHHPSWEVCMAATAPVPVEQPVLPEERFWQKHSPNQEFPISSLSSVALHVGAAVSLVLFFNFVIGSSRDTAMPVEVIEGFADSGGGGEANGSAMSPIAGEPRIERATEDEIPKDAPKPNKSMAALPDVLRDLPDLPTNPEANREADTADAMAKLDNAAKAPAPKKPTPAPPSSGKGNTGSGSGQGPGKGGGAGTGDQPGGQGTVRQNRNHRWTISFSTSSGTDYLKQLNALGAILVGEFADGSKFMYRQLGRMPVPAEPIDPELNTKMRWTDENPTFVADLSRAMGLERTPNYVKAYFPYKLENELLKLELAYRGRKEEEIHSTTFRVFLEGDGYRLVVSEQKYNN